MDENEKAYQLKLGKYGVVTVAGLAGLLLTSVVADVQSCRNTEEPAIDAGTPVEEDAGEPDAGDVIDASLPDAEEPEADAGVELPPSE